MFTPHVLLTRRSQFETGMVPAELTEVQRNILHAAALVIAASEAEARDVREVHPPALVEVVENGVDPGFQVLQNSPTSRQRKRLVTVCRLVPQKGLSELLESLPLLLERGIDVELAIAGEGPERTGLERRAHELGLHNRVSIIGQLNRDDVTRLLTAAHVYVQTSRYESFGIALLEAMAAGLPVAVTPDRVLSEHAAGGRGTVAASWEPEDIADAIEGAVAVAPATCANAAEYASQFAWETFADKVNHVLTSVPQSVVGVEDSPSSRVVDDRLVAELAREAFPGRKVVAVLTTGSQARGDHIRGDDRDALALLDGTVPDRLRQVWRYVEGVPIDLRVLALDVLLHPRVAPHLGAFASSWLGDYLHDATVRWAIDEHVRSSVNEALSSIAETRHSLAADLARHVLRAVRSEFDGAIRRRDTGAPLSAALAFRRAVRDLVFARLLSQLDYRARHSRRRPEDARRWLTSQADWPLLQLQDEAFGLVGLTLAEARYLVALRARLREALRSASIQRICSGPADTASTRLAAQVLRHNMGAQDYYGPDLERGATDGPVHHIRAFSGATRWPLDMARLRLADSASRSFDSHDDALEVLPLGDGQRWKSLMGLDADAAPTDAVIDRAIDELLRVEEAI